MKKHIFSGYGTRQIAAPTLYPTIMVASWVHPFSTPSSDMSLKVNVCIEFPKLKAMTATKKVNEQLDQKSELPR